MYTLSAHVRPNATKLIGRSFTVQVDNELEYSSMAKSVTWSQSNRAWFSVTEDKTEGLKDPQTSSNSRWLQWRPGKASPGRKLRIWWCPWAPDYRQSLTAKDFHPSIEIVLIFTVVTLSECYWAPEDVGTLLRMAVAPKWWMSFLWNLLKWTWKSAITSWLFCFGSIVVVYRGKGTKTQCQNTSGMQYIKLLADT